MVFLRTTFFVFQASPWHTARDRSDYVGVGSCCDSRGLGAWYLRAHPCVLDYVQFPLRSWQRMVQP